MQILKNVVVAILSVGAFGLGLFLAYQDKVAAAGVCIAAAVLPILFSNLPLIEYLKILGLEAKLRQRVDEADTIVTNLKRIAVVSAEQLFTHAAFAGRWGGQTLASKQARAGQLTSMLQGLDIPPADIEATKKMYLRAISLDLAYIFFSVLRNLLESKKVAIARDRDALFGKNPIDMRDPKAARWNELLAEERRIGDLVEWPENAFESEELDDLKSYCMTLIDSADVLTKNERSTLVAIADEVASLARACREAGNYTTETIRYLEQYQPTANYVNKENLRYATAFPSAAKIGG